jgi:hypothetical protein
MIMVHKINKWQSRTWPLAVVRQGSSKPSQPEKEYGHMELRRFLQCEGERQLNEIPSDVRAMTNSEKFQRKYLQTRESIWAGLKRTVWVKKKGA